MGWGSGFLEITETSLADALDMTCIQASSLVKIPTLRVRFPYPTWKLMMDSYNNKYPEFEISLQI